MSTCPLNPEENKDVKDFKQLTCYDLMKEQVKTEIHIWTEQRKYIFFESSR